MNKRAITVLNNVANLQRQAADALQMLLDNPDDAGLSHDGEIQLREAAATISQLAKELSTVQSG